MPSEDDAVPAKSPELSPLASPADRRRRWPMAAALGCVLVVAAAVAWWQPWRAAAPATAGAGASTAGGGNPGADSARGRPADGGAPAGAGGAGGSGGPGTRPGGPSSPGGPGGPGGGRPTPVSVAAVTRGPLAVTLSALGTVVPRNSVVVRPRVDGQLTQVLFTEGQTVKAGQVLALIDARSFEVQLASALGQLERDEAQFRNAQMDLARYEDLLAKDAIARQQVDTQAAQVRQFRAQLAIDQANVDAARLQLSYTRVVAPSAGRVGLRQVDAGNMVRATDANGLVLITEVQPVNVLFPVPQDALPRVLARLREVTLPEVVAFDRDGRTRLATGKLLTADNQVDVTTGTVRLKAEFPNTDSALFPNQFVNVRLLLETRDAVTLPSAAVQRGAPGAFAYVLGEEGTVSVRPLQLGQTDRDRIEVLAGVVAGDRVVVDGTDRLREGARVEVIDPAAAASAGGGGGAERRSRGDRKWAGQPRDAKRTAGDGQPTAATENTGVGAGQGAGANDKSGAGTGAGAGAGTGAGAGNRKAATP